MATEPKLRAKPRETARLTPSGKETIMDLLTKFTLDEAGASAVEYALLMAFIALAIVSPFGSVAPALGDEQRMNAAFRFRSRDAL
jgi:Flp pilus assembly pilin Flp